MDVTLAAEVLPAGYKHKGSVQLSLRAADTRQQEDVQHPGAYPKPVPAALASGKIITLIQGNSRIPSESLQFPWRGGKDRGELVRAWRREMELDLTVGNQRERGIPATADGGTRHC